MQMSKSKIAAHASLASSFSWSRGVFCVCTQYVYVCVCVCDSSGVTGW